MFGEQEKKRGKKLSREKLSVGSKSLDFILGGGIPDGTITLIGGPTGVGKSILAHQIVFANVEDKERTVYFTTSSTSVNRLIRQIQPFSFFDEDKISSNIIYEDMGELLVKEGLQKFIDFIEYQLRQFSIRHLVIDGLEALSSLSPSTASYQKFIYELLGLVGVYVCNTFLVGTYTWDLFRESLETRCADQAIWLGWEEGRAPYHRSMLVYKWTGGSFLSGKHTFTIGDQGVRVFPRFSLGKGIRKTDGGDLVSWGDALLDHLSSGGILAGSTTILYGDTGTGKTLTGLRFIRKGVLNGEPGAIISFQEDQQDLTAQSLFINWDLKDSIAKKEVVVLYISPIQVDLDELAFKIAQLGRECGIKRLFFNDISYLGKLNTENQQARFFEFLYLLQKFFKNNGITSIWSYPNIEVEEEGFLLNMLDNALTFRLRRAGQEKAGRWLELMKVRGKLFDARPRSVEVTPDGFLEGETISSYVPLKK